MRITIFSFTHNGAALAASLAKDLGQNGHLCQAFTMPKYAAEFHLQAIGKSVKDLTGPFFSDLYRGVRYRCTGYCTLPSG